MADVPEANQQSSSDRPAGGIQRRKAAAARKQKMVRLASLDAFRGFIMVMLGANGFGVLAFSRIAEDSQVWTVHDRSWWQRFAFHFEHSVWESISGYAVVPFWDLIQPAFMLMVGMSMPFSYARRQAFGQSTLRRMAHALTRSLVLVLMGVFLYSRGHARTNWIFPNVLAQIGLGYFFAWMLLNFRFAIQAAALCLILAGYWGWFFLNPPPDGYDFASFNASAERGEVLPGAFAPWSKNGNAAFILDQRLLPLLRTPPPDAAAEPPSAPAATAPAATDPAATDPAATGPAVTDPAVTDPAATDPAATDPAVTDPAVTDPAATDPAATDPAATDPAATDPAATDPTTFEPAETGADTTSGATTSGAPGAAASPVTTADVARLVSMRVAAADPAALPAGVSDQNAAQNPSTPTESGKSAEALQSAASHSWIDALRPWFFSSTAPYQFDKGGYSTWNFIPSIGTMLLGIMCGQLILSGRSKFRILGTLIAAALMCLLLGVLAHHTVCPIVKRIWTPSWVLFSGGYVIGMVALFYLLFDILPLRILSFPLVVVGMNSLLAYLLGQMIRDWTSNQVVRTHFTGILESVAGPTILDPLWYGAITESTATFVLFWLLLFWLYRQRIFLRI